MLKNSYVLREAVVDPFYSRYMRTFVLMALALFCLGGCGILPAVKDRTQLDLRIEAADDLNPDEKSRGAPILVRIYELKNDSTFNGADFFSLHDNDRATLGADVLARDELILRPGDVKTIRRKLNPETLSIGVWAGYRVPSVSRWRETIKLQDPPEPAWYRAILPSPKANFNIRLEQNAIVITDLD